MALWFAEKRLRTLNTRLSRLAHSHWKRSNAPIWWMKWQCALCVVALYLPPRCEFVGFQDTNIPRFYEPTSLLQTKLRACADCYCQVKLVQGTKSSCSHQERTSYKCYTSTYNPSFVENLAGIIRHEHVWVLCDSLWVLGWPRWRQIRDRGLHG